MAIKRFTGNAAATFDTWTYLVVTFTSTTVHGITINGKTVSITLGSGFSAATAAAALQLLLSASTVPAEFLEYTWTVDTATVTGTAKTAGIPATVDGTAGMTNASTGGTAGTLTNTITATGPNDIANAANWSTGTAITNNDTPVFDRYSPSALFNLKAWSALTGLTIETYDFPNSIGLPPVRGGTGNFDPQGGSGYPEYRNRFLLLSAGTPTLNIGRGDLVPARVNIEFGGSADAAAVNVFGLNTPSNGESATMFIKGLTGMDALNVTQGVVGVAVGLGETGGFTVVRIGSEESPQSDAKVIFGAGATVPSVENQSGSVESAATITALTMRAAASVHRQTGGNLTSVTAEGGKVYYETTGTVKGFFSGKAVLDFSRDPRPKEIEATSTFEDDANLQDPAGTCTLMNCTFYGNSLGKSNLGPETVVVRT